MNPDPKCRITPEARELAREYFAYAQKVAKQVVGASARKVSLDDASQAGAIGLMAAAGNYDPSLGVPFEAYAKRRIEGAVLDYIRTQGRMARSIRVKAARLEAAEQVVHARTSGSGEGRSFESEVASELGISVSDLAKIRSHIAASLTVSIDSFNGQVGPLNYIPSADASPEEYVLKAEQREAILGAVGTLSDREQFVLDSYYMKEETLPMIASGMGISQTRVGVIRDRALRKVRKVLKEAEQ